MINNGIQAFSGRRVLLLQGPMGSFFRRLADDLTSVGAQVTKVNFNGGDWLFYPRRALNYQDDLQHWPSWLHSLISERQIDLIFLFGDCRPMHQAALKVARRLGVEVGVFEEGYIRPNFVTLERFGVNGHSALLRTEPFDLAADDDAAVHDYPVGSTFSAMASQAFVYAMASHLGQPLFRHYRHHRPLGWHEAFCWLRSAWRKAWFQWRERGIQDYLQAAVTNRYYLVPLQVFNDSQVRVHASFRDVPTFIDHVLRSFARHAPGDTVLVFKHHPMDRGHAWYGGLIDQLARLEGLQGRVLYIHDQHLPTLLEHSKGVVVINSTVGLSALHHGKPTITCGNALYDLPGLTFQGPLDDFWTAGTLAAPEMRLYQRLRRHLIRFTQLNGSFYKRMQGTGTRCGLAWPAAQAPALAPPTLVPASAHAASEAAPSPSPIQAPSNMEAAQGGQLELK